MKFTKSISLSLLAFAFCTTVVQAQDPVQQDLIGAKGASSEAALTNRGFTHIKTERSGYNLYSYWWNAGAKHCICERISDGRVQSIVRTPSFDCNKTNEGSVNHYNNNHSSSHHDNGNHYGDNAEDAAFERGFTDGSHHYSYHNVYSNRNQRDAYEAGYERGSGNRSERGSHHYESGARGNYKGGFVDLNDLVGKNAKSAYAEMVDHRNFKEIHSFEHNGNHRKIMHNNKTGQCVEVVLHGDRIHEIKHYDDCDKYL